jgi:hypothetical protein
MIVSEKRIAANRANGALSHGPKTPEGKARSSRNAIKHGLLANIVTVRNENQEAFDGAVDAYAARLQPFDDLEYGMIEQMVAASWCLRRAVAIESHLLNQEMDARPNSPSAIDQLTAAFSELAGSSKLLTLHRYQTRHSLMHSRLLRDFIQLRKAVQTEPTIPNEPTYPPEINNPS